MTPVRATVAAIIASAVMSALYARHDAPWLVFVSLIPFMLALDRLAKWTHVLTASVALSVVFSALVFSWFPAAAAGYSGLPVGVWWAALVLFAPIFQPQFVTWALARHFLRGRALAAAIGGTFVYVGTELIFPKLFFDTIGQGLYASSLLRQGAALAGVHGLTIGVLFAAEAIARRRFAPLAGLLAAWLVYGALRERALASRETTKLAVGLVQANLTAYERLRAELGAYETVRLILDTHASLSDRAISVRRPELLIWPETVYPTTFGNAKSDAGAELDRELETFAAARGVPLIFGAYDREGEAEYNAAIFLPTRSVYRKHMLFPLTEWVPTPLEGPRFRSLFPWAGTWSRGPGSRRITLETSTNRELTVVPMICYDAVVPSFAAEAAAEGADLLVTLSNDAWFPDEHAPRLHLLSAAFRSIETGLPQARATSSGISALISPSGELLAEIPWRTRDAIVAELELGSRDPPPAVTWGPRLPWIAWLLALAAVYYWKRSRTAKYPGSAPK
jgi:apolipoprotein N-acyltransferase